VRNRELAGDYVRRAAARIGAIEVLFQAQSWPDVVRESQEAVELALKGLLLAAGVEPPRIHDVSDILTAERDRLPPAVRGELERLASISRDLRRDRELAFYGAADLTPSSFYTRQDAVRALDGARLVVRTVQPAVLGA
jgi:hypothetical protein